MNLEALRAKPARFIIGLTSGSSCSGIKAAVVRVKGTGPGLTIKLLHHQAFPLTPGLRTRLQVPRIDARETCLLNFEMGERLAEAALEMKHWAAHDGIEIDFVASDGHLLGHFPPRGTGTVGSLAIGESTVIAARTDLPVVDDFRSRDMAAGGQGSTLAGYPQWLLFGRKDRTVVSLGMGGLLSCTVVTPRFDDVMTFDVGPCGLAIDGAMRLLTAGSKETDEGGETAKRGVVIDEFLDYLLDHPYFSQVPPKSTSREEFGAETYLRDALNSRRGNYGIEDLMATVTTAVAYSMARAYKRFIVPNCDVARIVVSGGCSQNALLIGRMEGMLEPLIRSSDEYGLDYDAVSPVAAAVLGNETFCGSPSNAPKASGAREAVVLGRITPA
jgi:anhydro-N-acetylmuramic acid kinase